jgi:replicative DNA helicase
MVQLASNVVLAEFDAEATLLGSYFAKPEAFLSKAGSVRSEWFTDELLRYMFDECTKLAVEGHTLTMAVIISMLPEDIAGTPRSQFYTNLRLGAVPMEEADSLVTILKDRWARRQLIEATGELVTAAKQFGQDPFKLASEAIVSLDAIATVAAPTTARRVSVAQAAEAAHAMAVDRSKHGVVSGVTWGLADLNAVTRLHPGELTICAARPSMGKTTLGLHTCLAAAKAGDGVLFISLEMGDVALGQRVVSSMCWDEHRSIPYAHIRDREMTDDELERISDVIARLQEVPLWIEQEAGLNVLQITARARKARREMKQAGHELGLLVVDHLGLIAAADRYAGARHLELGAMTSALKALAKDMGIPVLLLCQLSRGVEGRDNKRPMLSDLRESGRIEEDADAVVLLYREAYYLERARESDPDKDAARIERLAFAQNRLEINVAKQRQGATKTVEAFVSMPSNVVRNAARGY